MSRRKNKQPQANQLTKLVFGHLISKLPQGCQPSTIANALNASTAGVTEELEALNKMLLAYPRGSLWFGAQNAPLAKDTLGVEIAPSSQASAGRAGSPGVPWSPAQVKTSPGPKPASPAWLQQVGVAAAKLLGRALLTPGYFGLMSDFMEQYGLNDHNTTPADAAELWHDSIVQDAADAAEKDRNMGKKQAKKAAKKAKNGHNETPEKEVPDTTSNDGDGGSEEKGEKKAKVRYYSTKETDYSVRILEELVTQHGVPRDPWGEAMVLREARKGIVDEGKKTDRATKKAEREASKVLKAERAKTLETMTDEQKKEFAAKERKERKEAATAKALAERAELEAKIRAEMLAKGEIRAPE